MTDYLTIENPLDWRSRALLAESEEERLRAENEKLWRDREQDVATLDIATQMREAQKRYFKERTQSALTESKRLEKLLDKMLARDKE